MQLRSREDWHVLGVQTYQLPPSLFVPIAAASVDAVQEYVGEVLRQVPGRDRVNAVLVAAPCPILDPAIPIWSHSNAAIWSQRLHPRYQVWVHVDFAGYRKAWHDLGQAELKSETFLDHVQNREAVRLRGYDYPYLRLCPVSRSVNTSGGAQSGGEGMEKEYARTWTEEEILKKREERASGERPVVLADPMDLTKMLDVPPGTQVLDGVNATQKLFYGS